MATTRLQTGLRNKEIGKDEPKDNMINMFGFGF
jgi:hypothetical protein